MGRIAKGGYDDVVVVVIWKSYTGRKPPVSEHATGLIRGWTHMAAPFPQKLPESPSAQIETSVMANFFQAKFLPTTCRSGPWPPSSRS